jgi:hypothetical protein
MDTQKKLISLRSTDRYQTFVTTTAVQTSTAIQSTTVLIAASSVAHYIAIGDNPVVDNNSFVIPLNTVLEFGITQGHKVATKAVSSGGFLSLSY